MDTDCVASIWWNTPVSILADVITRRGNRAIVALFYVLLLLLLMVMVVVAKDHNQMWELDINTYLLVVASGSLINGSCEHVLVDINILSDEENFLSLIK